MKTTRELAIEQYSTHLQRTPQMTRHVSRSLQRSLGAWLPADRNAPILDAACGEGNLLAFLRAQGYANLSGFDLSPECVKLCHERGLDFVRVHDVQDIASFPGPEGGWAVVFCMDLLEHIPRERAAGFLISVRSRLAKGGPFDREQSRMAQGRPEHGRTGGPFDAAQGRTSGCLILQTVNMSYLCANSVLYGDLTHETGYTEASLLSLLKLSGFARAEIRPHWYATTLRGRARELCLRWLHRAVYLAEGGIAPRIPTKNLLARAYAE